MAGGLGGAGSGGGDGEVRAPFPVGVVLTARDRVLQAMEVLKAVLGEEVAASVQVLYKST